MKVYNEITSEQLLKGVYLKEDVDKLIEKKRKDIKKLLDIIGYSPEDNRPQENIRRLSNARIQLELLLHEIEEAK